MGFGLSHPDLSVYRLVKSGESGLNLNLSDLFPKVIKVPSFFDIVVSFFSRKSLVVLVEAYPVNLIRRLEFIQKKVDEEIKAKIDKARRDAGV
jgi:hypothetical protein